MKIRSITCFYDPKITTAANDLENLARMSEALKKEFESAKIPVQSTRIATSPFPYYFDLSMPDKCIDLALMMEKRISELGWSYLSLGPALPDYPNSYSLIPEILAQSDSLFFSGVIGDQKQLYPDAALACARVIEKSAAITHDGFANLRFTAIANVPPFTPFFPAAYHQQNGKPAFSLAMECADLAIKAFSEGPSLNAARQKLVKSFENLANLLEPICQKISFEYNAEFMGFDFSPAPFPNEFCSLGKAIESLGLNHLGGAGSLAAAAIVADTLDQGSWRRAGFNGLMLPILEDSILSIRAEEGVLSIKDLLLYSAVCGTGLDTVPLSGDSTAQDLYPLLLDVGALAVRLGKPLSARLMPIPGKKAGDRTSFDFEYFSNSGVINLETQTIGSFLTNNAPIPLTPRIKLTS